MAYFDNDMDAEQMPVVDRMDAEYTIYVNNLPVELNEDGVRDIFGQYGRITAVCYPKCATWAYVTYGTYGEAEHAIRELNDKRPLRLKVTLAKQRSTKEVQKSNALGDFQKSSVNIADSLSTHNAIKYQNMGRDQSTNSLHKHVMPQMTLPHRYTDCGLLSSSSFPQTANEIDDPYANTNKLWTRGVITVTSDGKRHVSLGRGYTLYEYPEPFPKVEECILKIHEQRNSGSYEYFENKFKNEEQNCSVCSTKTTKHCEKCRTYYCSKVCQLEDWPQHQAECERIPALVEETTSGISSLHINQDIKQTTLSPNVINKTAKSSDVKLRRPNTLNAMQAENSSDMSTNINKSNADVTYSNNNDTRDRYLSDQCDNDTNVSQSENVSQIKMTDQSVNAANTKEFSPKHRLRRYNNTENTNQSRKNECHTTSFPDQSRYNRNNENSNKTSPNKERFDNSNVRDRTSNNDRNRSQSCGFQNDKDSACYNNEDINGQGNSASNNSLVNNDLAFYKDTHLSKTKFITVEVIIPLNNGEYWIYKLEDTDARINLMMKLQNVANKSCKVQPIVGEVYGVLYETLWHRAMITSLNPIKVHFIDFGNDEILEKTDIKDIGDLTKAPKYARKIRLTQGTSDKYMNLQQGEQISVKMLSVDSEKTIIVEVQEQSENPSNNAMKKSVSQENSKVLSPNKNAKSSTIQIPSILDAFANLLIKNAVSELQIDGFIQFHETKQKNIYSATLSPQGYCTEIEMLFKDLQEECSKVQASADYKPKAEDLVCGWHDGWYRGYVSICPKTSSEISIITVDEAKVLSVHKIMPCPEKFLNVYAFGVICEINHPTFELELGKVYEFTSILNDKSYKQASLKIEIITNSEMVQAVVKPWKSLNSSIRLLSEIKNGSKVCLTSYRSHFYMFARSLDEADIEYYNNIMQCVAQYAQTAPCLTEPPVSKQIVIAPFEDGNYYRAMVLAIQNDKVRIVYIDFGNIDDVDMKDLKVMPQCHLELQQSCSGKIILKDVPQDIPSNQEVDIYIRNLVGKEVPLICTYEGTPIKDGVRLIMPSGECVNDTINQLLIPGWKREKSDEDTRCYMLNDIEVASLGRVGDTVDALVLFLREDDRTKYIMGPLDFELITHVSEVMPVMLKEYCEKMEYYIPRAEELCLALYEGAWYRAACLNPKESYTTAQILFIDYGNIEIVEHKNIRLMPKDFIAPAAIANICTVVNLAPVDNNGNYSQAVQKKLEELVVQNSYSKIKIIECIENGDYKIELPDVRAALIQHGLV